MIAARRHQIVAGARIQRGQFPEPGREGPVLVRTGRTAADNVAAALKASRPCADGKGGDKLFC